MLPGARLLLIVVDNLLLILNSRKVTDLILAYKGGVYIV